MSTEALLDCRLIRKNYLQINAFPDLIVIEQEKSSHVLPKKTPRRAISELIRKTAS